MIAKPIGQITLTAADGMHFELSVLFDTGADVSLFSPSVARLLGVDVSRGVRGFLSGLGGQIEVLIHEIPIRIGSHSRRIRAAFATHEVPNILGRLDVLRDASWSFVDEDHFVFRYRKGTKDDPFGIREVNRSRQRAC